MNVKKGFILFIAATGLFISGCDKDKSSSGTIPVKKIDAKQAEQVGMLLPDFTQLLERGGPSVVNIQATKVTTRQTSREGYGQLPEGDPFYDFFKDLTPNEPDANANDETSYGSGFIISSDGYILTNTHVVSDSANIKVTLNDKREYVAKLVGLDAPSDVALLKIEAKDLSSVSIGSSTDLKVGEWVAAIGAPFGFNNTLTAGIVSAKGRSLPNDNYIPFIQTDVAINPGNSGGPLFDLKGQVVGINSRIYSGSGGFMGISFAVPIDIAMNVAEQLRTTGKVVRGQLGVQVQEVNYDLATSFGLEKPLGALVVKVSPAGPADLGKVLSGDIIISVDGKPVNSSSDLPMMVGAIAPGKIIKLGIWRQRKETAVDVKLGEAPNSASAEATQAPDALTSEGQSLSEYGLDLTPLTENIKAETKLEHGLLVLNAVGKASLAGLSRGDIILSVNYVNVNSVEELANVLKTAKGSVPMMLRRGTDTLYVALNVD